MSVEKTGDILVVMVGPYRVCLADYNANGSCECDAFEVLRPFVGHNGYVLRCCHILEARAWVMRNWLETDEDCDYVILHIYRAKHARNDA